MSKSAAGILVCFFLLNLVKALNGQEKDSNAEGVNVTLRVGEPGSKLAPRYSPKGRQFKLSPSTRTDLEGVSPIESRLQMGSMPGDGFLAVLTRPSPDRPYDRLYLDENNDGTLNEPAIQCEPKANRGNTWSSFEGNIAVNHAAKGKKNDLLPFPISLWVVVEKESDTPELIRISRRGFLYGEVKTAGADAQLIVSDGDNDGVIREGDWWELRTSPPGKTSGMREIGDFQWGGGKAWKLKLDADDWRKATLVPHDPEMTEAEDALIRDHLREDRIAERAAIPVKFRKDYEAALAEGQSRKSRCFIKFETEWCGPCKTMAELVFTAKEVAESAKDIQCIIVDGDESKSLVEKHKVKGYPTGILLDADGNEIARYSGYQSVKQTAAFLKRINAPEK